MQQEQKRLKIAYICGYSEDAYGGVQTVVPQYLEHMAQVADVSILSIGTKKFESTEKYKVLLNEDAFWKQSFDLVVFHEVYYIPYHRIARKLIKKQIRYIVIPHGSLTREAQMQKTLLKKVFNLVWGNYFIKNASMIQFLSESERQRSSNFNIKKSEVIPNGIDNVKIVERKRNETEKKLKLLFIGRLSIYYKGLDLLLEACSTIREQMLRYNVQLDIYGTDFENGKVQLKKWVKEYQLESCVHIHDGIYGEEKHDILLSHDIFIQPSRSEGLPMGILEAMEYGLPVIVTPGTTFYDIVKEEDCGWSVQGTVQDIANCMSDIIEDKSGIKRMSLNAQMLVARKYTWEKIIDMTCACYSNVVNRL